MPIFSPTAKPATLVTGTLVEPTGIVITGPSGRGCHSVVVLPAAVPSWRSCGSPRRRRCRCRSYRRRSCRSVLLTWMVVSPLRAGTASPELERPSR